ncbi:mitogen-activated protein kinase kinase kinase YODA-like isoform X2 [Magnolia sinica]|uniref:mitogen-activated protein kinase kinase kinase YODA-like isoform X2 n=1 Tax=Magnolia sinica TaxID=86752 RepID=UPI00265AD14C|nr:mitogen-activated protein kinase kinase kinase YODA-like isoform X2 [Magnolia sinica]
MHWWWGKSSSKEVKKKTSKESFLDTLQRKFKIPSEEKGTIRSGGYQRRNSDIASVKGSQSRAESRSPSPSTLVSRCESFAERPCAQPLPLPKGQSSIERTASGISISRSEIEKSGKPSLISPLPRPDRILNRQDATYVDGDLASASVSSGSSIDSDDPIDSCLLTPLENGSRAVVNSPSRLMHKDESPVITRKDSRETLRPANLYINNQSLSSSPKRGFLNTRPSNLQIHQHGGFGIGSAPDSSMSSPSRSPMRVVGPEQIMTSAFWAANPYPDISILGSGHCSSPGSGHYSGHNSTGGDMSGQLFWQHSRGSPECSPIPSPRMTSPGPSSRIQSGAVTPLHPRAGGTAPESPMSWPEDRKQQSHRLPLPPLTICNSSPFSPSNSGTAISPSVPRSPGRAENPTSPGSRWKKGKLLGRGTFGDVYAGFNSESGDMCAMKEVTLFADDAKSKESAKQLMQMDDKLYIYLEYVSGGSIHKLLQEYGQFGELVIRSYTHQILSGLAYLHAKDTVHRDIKGANILVDPNGRVKLADFGMAKHISSPSCPLSFYGSPYWKAPEVIKNSNGCNLAVDIWSLGCTVLEMATTKPPWSQYEGIAAMFKIGNSKELPAIPDYLSDDGKDFVKQCLQRNPLYRPTAAQLLEHPFVKNAAPVERPILSSEPLELSSGVMNGMKSMSATHVRTLSSLDMEELATHQPTGSKTSLASSDSHRPLRNMSCPVSPIGSPLLHSRSPQHMNGGMSPSPISSPRTTSGSSTPLSGGNGAIPFHHLQQSAYLHEGFVGSMPRNPNSLYINGSTCHDPKPDIFRVMQSGSHAFCELMASETDILGRSFRRPVDGDPQEPYDRQSALADPVAQQLPGDHVKLNPSIDFSAGSSMLGRLNGKT